MGRTIQFTPRGERELKSLSREIQRRIQKKLREHAAIFNPLIHARPLTNLPPATHRYRIGQYRVSFFIEQDVMYVELVKIRGRAYIPKSNRFAKDSVYITTALAENESRTFAFRSLVVIGGRMIR